MICKVIHLINFKGSKIGNTPRADITQQNRNICWQYVMTRFHEAIIECTSIHVECLASALTWRCCKILTWNRSLTRTNTVFKISIKFTCCVKDEPIILTSPQDDIRYGVAVIAKSRFCQWKETLSMKYKCGYVCIGK